MLIPRSLSRPSASASWLRLGLALVALVGAASGPSAVGLPPAPTASAAPAPDGAPLAFVPNRGQIDPQVRFLANSPGGALFFTSGEVVMAVPQAASPDAAPAGRDLDPASLPKSGTPVRVTRLRFLGANPAPAVTGVDPLPGAVNYFLGDDPARWRTGLPSFAGIVYRDLYPGIDLQYQGAAGQIKGTYFVAAGADAGLIRWRYDAAALLQIDAASGDLRVRLPSASAAGSTNAPGPEAQLVELAPVAWQEVQGARVPVAARYVLNADGSVGFALPKGYDRAQPLTLDPTLVYATYLGGFAEDNADAVAVDGSGNIYVGGLTFSTNFPTQNPRQGSNAGGADAYVTKFDPTGATALYSTYLGGTGFTDYGLGLAVDEAGNAYLTGLTDSTDFPTAGPPYQDANAGLYDVFVAKLDPTGANLLYSTYLGGAGLDLGLDIAVAPTGGVAYVTGRAEAGFPTAGSPYQASFGGGASDGFVARVTTTLTGTASLPYSSYVGGTGEDRGSGLTVDSATSTVYLTGRTASTDFPLTGAAFQNTPGGGFDAYVLRLDTAITGTAALAYSTYFGGGGDDRGLSIARDSGNDVYVTGRSLSTDLPTSAGAFDSTCGTDGNCDFDGTQSFIDAFVARFDPGAAGAASRVYATYLGGERRDEGEDITVNPATGEAYLTGYTNSTRYPVQNAFQYTCGWGCGQVFSDPVIEGFTDAFLTRLDSAGTALVFSSYLGGSSADFGFGILLDASASTIYWAGESYSTDFPLINPYQSFNSGNYDVTLARFDNAASASANLSVIKTDSPDPVFAGETLTYTLAVANAGPDTAPGVRLVDMLPDTGDTYFIGVASSLGSCSLPNSVAVSCSLGDLANGASGLVTVTLGVNAFATGTTVTNTASVAANVVDPNGNDNSATQLTALNRSADLVVTKSDEPDPVSAGQALTYTVELTNAGPSGAVGVLLTDTLPAGVTLSSAFSLQGVCSGTGTVVCDLGSLFPNASASVTIVVNPTAAGLQSNVVSVSSNTFDPDLADNTDTENTTVNAASTPTSTATATATRTSTPTRTATATATPTGTPVVPVTGVRVLLPLIVKSP